MGALICYLEPLGFSNPRWKSLDDILVPALREPVYAHVCLTMPSLTHRYTGTELEAEKLE